MSPDDFYVEDEPLADVLAAFEGGRKAVTMRPGITVLIATHPERQTSGLINRAFASVAAQTLQPVEIHVRNDVPAKVLATTASTCWVWCVPNGQPGSTVTMNGPTHSI